MAIELTSHHYDAAKQVLDHPVVQQIFENMVGQKMAKIINSKDTELDEILQAKREIAAINTFQRELMFIVSEGAAKKKASQVREVS